MVEINNTTKAKIGRRAVERAAEKFLVSRHWEKKTVSIAFIGDARMKFLNRRYRRKDKTTDVLSFAGEGDFLGEILISYPRIRRQAAENGRSVKDELLFILVHGLLHLAGRDDETERGRRAMIGEGERFLKSLKK